MTRRQEIDKLLRLLKHEWFCHKEYRLGQLLANMLGHHTDPFYWRDGDIMGMCSHLADDRKKARVK